MLIRDGWSDGEDALDLRGSLVALHCLGRSASDEESRVRKRLHVRKSVS